MFLLTIDSSYKNIKNKWTSEAYNEWIKLGEKDLLILTLSNNLLAVGIDNVTGL